MIRSAGAREVHVRISSPPIQWPCYYGIDTPTRKELIGSSHSPEEIRRYLGADSLGYLSLDGMLKATGSDPGQFCHACFTGNYRVGIEPEQNAPPDERGATPYCLPPVSLIVPVFGLALAPYWRSAGCRARHRARALNAALDRYV